MRNFFRSLKCVFLSFTCAVLGVSVAAVSAQEGPPIRNLGASRVAIEGDWLAYCQWESFQGEDLNGDGDRDDSVVHVENVSTGETTNLMLCSPQSEPLFIAGDWLVFNVFESPQGEDLNGDGDTTDVVVHVRNLATGEATNTELDSAISEIVVVSADWVLIRVREQSEDLNGDGDTEDWAVYVYNLAAGQIMNLSVAGFPQGVWGDWLVLRSSETDIGDDLNGDGDTDDSVVHILNLTTGETRILRAELQTSRLVSEEWIVIWLDETDIGDDLNGDGDIEDSVVHLHSLATGETTKPEVRFWPGTLSFFPQVSRDWLATGVLEQDEDLNGDGDTGDAVVHVYNLVTGETRNLRLAGHFTFDPANPGGRLRVLWGVAGDWAVVAVSEERQSEDLNEDGDQEDVVVHVHNLTTGETENLSLALREQRSLSLQSLFASGDWLVIHTLGAVHVRNLATGETKILDHDLLGGSEAWFVSEDWLVIGVDEDVAEEDLNGDSDETDWVVQLVDLRRTFTRGEANADGNVDISDGVFILSWLFLGGETPSCFDAADTDDSGAVDISDAVALFGFLFLGQAPPPAPGSDDCGFDQTADPLGCRLFEHCRADG